MPRAAFPFVDEGDDLGERAHFDALLRRVRRESQPPVIIASEITRLLRTRRDLNRITSMLANREVAVAISRPELNTDDPGGEELFKRLGEFTVFAYEGPKEPFAAASQRELVDLFVGRYLRDWGDCAGLSEQATEDARTEMRVRMCSLLQLGCERPADVRVLCAPWLELAVHHQPADVDTWVRAWVLLAVRATPVLEAEHVAGPIQNHDWRLLTSAAAQTLSALGDLPAGELSACAEPGLFTGIADAYPGAWAAFAALARVEPGTEAYEFPAEHRHDWFEGDFFAPVLESGADVVDATDERIPVRLAQRLREAEGGVVCVPSFKHLSRNVRKLFRIVDCVLANGGVIETANSMIAGDVVARRSEFVDYNSFDQFGWAGVGSPSTVKMKTPGRNDPCPCGSGKKYKRCCGASESA